MCPWVPEKGLKSRRYRFECLIAWPVPAGIPSKSSFTVTQGSPCPEFWAVVGNYGVMEGIDINVCVCESLSYDLGELKEHLGTGRRV